MQKKHLILPFIVCLFFLSQFLSCNLVYLPEEGMVDWISTFCVENFMGIHETDKGFIVAGNDDWSNDLMLIITDQQGKEMWRHNIYEPELGGGNCIQQAEDFGLIMTVGPIIIKINQYGKKIWGRKYGGYISYVQQISDKHYIVLGKDAYVYLIKIDVEGNKMWEKVFVSGIDIEWTKSHVVNQTSDRGFIFSGCSFSDSIGWGNFIVKTDKDGNEVWRKIINTNYEPWYAQRSNVKETPDGGYIVFTTIAEGEDKDFYLIKLDPEGNISWSKTYGEKDKNEIGYCSVLRSTDGCFLLAGDTGWNTLLIKVDSNGKIIWERKLCAANMEFGAYIEPWSVIESKIGGYVIGGIAEVSDDHTNMFLMKIGR